MIGLFFGGCVVSGLCALGAFVGDFLQDTLEFVGGHAEVALPYAVCSVVNRMPGLAAAAARALLGVHHVDKVREWAADRSPTSATLDWPPLFSLPLCVHYDADVVWWYQRSTRILWRKRAILLGGRRRGSAT